MEAAVRHCTEGIGVWQWASNDQGVEPDVVMACCGDVPTLETLAAVSLMREHLPDLKIRVVNVVDLMKLQPQSEHPHGLSDRDFDELFTKDKPVIFAFHAYPWLIHRLTYRRTNHHNIHVRGYKEEGTITTPFDMTVLNDLDRFHLVIDTIDRLPETVREGDLPQATAPGQTVRAPAVYRQIPARIFRKSGSGNGRLSPKLWGSGGRRLPERAVEFPCFREKLAFGQMVFVHGQRSDDPSAQFGVMEIEPRDKLFHFAASRLVPVPKIRILAADCSALATGSKKLLASGFSRPREKSCE